MKLTITKMDHLGKGISKYNDKVIFIPKTIPGDICEVTIYKQNKKYDIAKLDKIITKSNLRVDAICPYYYTCGGCNISNLDYENQLIFKENKVKDIFKKYLNTDITPNVLGSKNRYGYRNKVTYHYDSHLGLVSEFSGIIDIKKCLIADDEINKAYTIIKKEDLSNVKTITIRKCDNGLTLNIIGNMNIDNISKYFIAINMNNKSVYKKDDGYISINNIKYKVSINSFFQINTSNIHVLYDEIIRIGEFNKNDTVIDLYCGVGSISLYIAKYVKKVLGIEIIGDAINDAKYNAKLNHIDNASFLCGDVAKLIDDTIKCDTLIVDPPRTGLDKHTIEVINNTNIKKIIYVSCDVMSLVRDINNLSNYKMSNISIVDMFPETHHCECIITLKHK